MAHRLCSSWTQLVGLTDPQSWVARFLLYLWYNDNLGVIQSLSGYDGFAAIIESQSYISSLYPTRSVGGVDEIAAGRSKGVYDGVLYPAITFVRMLKQNVYDKTIYTLAGADMSQYLEIRSFFRAHGTVLLYAFSDLE